MNQEGNNGATLTHFITGRVSVNTTLEHVTSQPITDDNWINESFQCDAVVIVFAINLFLKNSNYYQYEYDEYDTWDEGLKEETKELKSWDFLRKQVFEGTYHSSIIVVLTKMDKFDMIDLYSEDINPIENASKFLKINESSIFRFSNYTEEEYGKERNPEKDYNARNLLLRLFAEAENIRKMKIISPKLS